ncbi:hypothetical protein F5I97DRAFT_1910820 [Phlebopus sp. FC_14]|nr:hypothetical protein F5I97DRAFT_1910820 [Phlebopus sp. FC_14]
MDRDQTAYQSNSTSNTSRYSRQRPYRRADLTTSTEEASTPPSEASGNGTQPRHKKERPPKGSLASRDGDARSSTPPRATASPRQPLSQPNQTQDHPPKSINAASSTTSSNPSPAAATPPQPRSRRAKFRSNLTEPTDNNLEVLSGPSSGPAVQLRKPKPKGPPAPTGDDLTSTLTRVIRTSPFPDCLICFSPIRPEHPTWSCSPSASHDDVLFGNGTEDKPPSQCCWTTFHLKCIRSWAEKSMRDLAEAWRSRGEARPGEWRCPGCQAKRLEVPRTYTCFCHRVQNPTTPRFATPHSCAQSCARPRASGCKHACPLQCHPGPCRPCAVTVRRSCFCGKEQRSVRCSAAASTAPSSSAGSFSCTKTCDRPLSCGNPAHRCLKPCHPAGCSLCTETEQVRCWCGRERKNVACGELVSVDGVECTILNSNGEEERWFGRFGCSQTCDRPFACMHHICSQLCHPPSRIPPPCPFDPERVARCACGRCRVSSISGADLGSVSAHTLLPARTSCSSPLPTCTSPCSKRLPCGHTCKATCHWDTCPPCTEQVERACRCGGTKRQIKCADNHVSASSSITPGSAVPTEFLCNRPCLAFRACGKHQCRRICCPLSSIASAQKSRSKKRRDIPPDVEELGTEEGGLHECDLICGRVMPCSNHRCQRKDHKGPCGVCLKSIFEELSCPCGRTVMEPPIPCGTRLDCTYPCARLPWCGHPAVLHPCHEGIVIAGADTADEGLGPCPAATSDACPPCPVLTNKECTCGKKIVDNVRCSQEKISCGIVCGRLLSCGFHRCERSCHADECGPCTAVCGKARKSCLPAQHPCTQICHAPAACPETEPCLSPVTVTCPCGHLQSIVPCSGTKQKLQCSGECAKMKRSAQLAEAFGISEDKRREGSMGKVIWSDELVMFGRAPANAKFVGLVEKAFEDFVSSSKPTQVLPPMPQKRRKFVHDVASVYRMDTTMVDQEPSRSVQLFRRIDTRIPSPLLSQQIATAAAARVASSGKLAHLQPSSPSAGGSSRVLGSSGVGAWSSPLVQALRAAATSEVRVGSDAATSVAARMAEKAVEGEGNGPVPNDWEDDA